MNAPHTPAGGVLLNCELDDTCASLDCDAVVDEYAQALLETPEGEAFVAHYCGLDYVDRLRAHAKEE